MIQIQTQSSSERYVPVDIASDEYYAIYAHHHKSSYEYSDDYDPSLDNAAGAGGFLTVVVSITIMAMVVLIMTMILLQLILWKLLLLLRLLLLIMTTLQLLYSRMVIITK